MLEEVPVDQTIENTVTGDAVSSASQVNGLESIVSRAEEVGGGEPSAGGVSIRDGTAPALAPHISIPPTGKTLP